MSTFSLSDVQYMTKALALANAGLYTTSPNPRVGCVIVSNNKIIGQGAHLKAGEPHAEVLALREAGNVSLGATAYVTLEPCSHFGKTPPCADALIQAGIMRVVIAMQDPNPLVAGQGMARLATQGLQVEVGCMEAEARALNKGFIKRMSYGMPYVRSKIAASLDGKTALKNGKSQWITGEAARQDVQHWRAQSCAVVTGIGTVLADNPRLNVRLPEVQRQPLRVIVDSDLQIPLDTHLLQNINAQQLVMIVYAQDKSHRAEALQATGATLLLLPTHDGAKVDLNALLARLALQGLNEVLLEAGRGLNTAFLQADLIDEFILYYAPKFMGHDAQGMFNLPEITHMSTVPSLTIADVTMVGQDIRLLATPVTHHPQ